MRTPDRARSARTSLANRLVTRSYRGAVRPSIWTYGATDET